MNKYKVLKASRIVISLFVLLAFLSIFLFSKNILAAAAGWQMIPAGIRTIAAFGVVTASIFALVLLMTAVFGRFYCSFICPFGVLQDIAIRLAKIIRLPRSKKLFTRNHRRLRYSVLAVLTATLFLGAAIPLGLFGPFASFGRFSAAVVKPAFNWLNNLIVDNALLEGLYPRANPPFSLLLLIIGGGAVIAIMAAAAFRGRLFCNTLCPAGAVLGLLNRISWFKIAFSRHTCIKCGKCAKVCKANCIDIKNGIVDTERCVNCFSCAAACGYGAINYLHQKAEKSPKPDLSRRDFFVIGGSALLGAAVLPKLLRTVKPAPNAVMPPGALDFDRFTAKCTACQLCVSNCPGNVIKPAALQYGLSGFLQPRLDFDAGMCEFECTACSNICPNGALEPLPVERKKRLQIGQAQYFRDRCVVVTDRTFCGACAEHCPTGAVHMVEWEEGLTIPKVEPELCIGCGGCQYICPVKPDKAIIVSGLQTQKKAKVAKLKQAKNHLQGKDFPF